jgi:hypothetical protein
MGAHANNHDSASYDAIKSSRIEEDLAHTRSPYECSGEDDKTAMEHISIYLSQLGFAGKEDYMRVQNFSLSLTGIAFAWFTSLPRYIVGSWSQLEEQFYDFFWKDQ